MRLLFHGRRLYLLVFCSTFWFCAHLEGPTLLTYTALILKSLVTHPSNRTALIEQIIITGVYVVVGLVVAVLVIEKLGGRVVGVWGFVVPAVAVLAMAYLIHTFVAAIILFTIATTFELAGPANVYFVSGSELSPTALRGRALSISNAIVTLGSLLGVLPSPIITKSTSLAGARIVLAVTLVFGGIVAVVRGPETKGRSLDELEADITLIEARSAVVKAT